MSDVGSRVWVEKPNSDIRFQTPDFKQLNKTKIQKYFLTGVY